MSEESKKPGGVEEEGENHLYSFIVGGFIVIAIMVIFVLLFNH